MPKGRHTIEDVRAAGYEVGFASGSVEAEERALADARTEAAPEQVMPQAESVATSVAQVAVAQGVAGDELTELVTRATKQALNGIQGARDERVAFHERALAAAKEMPDVYFVSALGDPKTPDDDVRLYVACKPDGTGWDKGAQEILNALVAERK